MTKALEMIDVSYRYPNAQDWSLRNINLEVEVGSFIAIMGSNGAGKTTLCHCLNGLIPQLIEGEITGQIVVNNLDTAKYRVQTLARTIGMVLQDPESQIFSQIVWEDAAFGPCNFAYPQTEIQQRVHKALNTVRLTGLEHRKTTELSGGQKQRLAVAGILAQSPEILVLDEPAAELDPQGCQELYELLDSLRRERQVTVIVTEHSPEPVIDRADEVIVLKRGEIAWRGTPKDLFSNELLLRRLGLRPPKSVFDLSNGQKDKKTIAEPPLIEFRKVDYFYPSSYQALQGINLKVYPGEFLALIGANGAGKSTLAKHLNGLLKPTRGDVIVAGMNTKDCSVYQLAGKVGYLFQNPDHQIFAASVEEEIAYGIKNIGLSDSETVERINQSLSFTGLTGVRHSHPYALSRGERQLLAVASIAALRPEILVVDEPTSGLDWPSILKLMDMITQLNELGTTVVMISHDLELVRKYASRAVVFDNGKVRHDGMVAEIFALNCLQQSLETASGLSDNTAPVKQDLPELKVKGFLHSLDARTKVTAFLVMLLACLFASPHNYVALGLGIGFLTLWAGVRPKSVATVLTPLIPVFLLMLIGNSIVIKPGYHFTLGATGLVRGITFVLRTVLIILTTAFFTATTTVEELVQLLHKIKVPPVIAFTITTALRFIPALDQKRTQILEAQRARGAKLEAAGIIGPVKAYIPIMVPLLIYSITLANSLAMAMLNRGFALNREITFLGDAKLSKKDYFALGFIAITVSCTFYATRIWRW